MRTSYLVILDYASSEIIIIRLGEEQLARAKTFARLEYYVETLEEDYHFTLKDCSWMISESLHERSYL